MAVPLVDRHVEEGRGSRPALRTDASTISYAELQALVNRAGNALRAAGVASEQRVAILLPDGPEFVATFIGAMKIGAVPVPINTAARQAELRFMLDDSRARALVVHGGLMDAVTDSVPTVLVVGGDGASFAAALQCAPPVLDAFRTGVDEPCYWLY